METLELDQSVPSQQTPVAVNKDQRSTSVGESGGGGSSSLFETQISVEHVDVDVGDVSVVQVSLSESGRKMRGRKRKDKDAIFSNGVHDSAKKTAKSLSLEEEGEEEDDDVEEEEEEGMVGEEGHEFCVGDFVWAKIKSYPWWPGQIYSPSDASASAAKYKRRNRLLVACFGDKTFAWCYPFQLKPFQENFHQLVKESNSKSFAVAVEEAVNEIGSRLDVQMACSCVPVENLPTKPLVVNAGIKEGVAAPNAEIGELSINQFDPATFLSSIKYIAQTVSIDNVLELLVLKGRLSGFYRTKGYYRLPEFHEPVRIHEPMTIFVQSAPVDNGLASEGNGEDQMKDVDVNEIAEESDWLTSSAVPEVGSTGITISRRLSSISEDKLLQSKKQRSVADLMAEEKEGSVSAKPRGRPKKRKENMGSEVGSDVAEELAMSGKEASFAEEGTITPRARGRPKKRIENMGSDGRKDVTEELAMPGKEALLHEGGTVTATANGKSKRKRETVDLNMDSEIGSDVAEELTISGKVGSLAEEGSVSAKTRGKPKRIRENLVSEVGSEVAEELISSGKKASSAEEGTMSAKPRGRRKKTKEDKDSKERKDVTEESAKVTGNVAEEMTVSSKQALLAEEGTVSAKPRGRLKKAGEKSSSERGIDVATEAIQAGSDVAQGVTISGEQSPLAEEGTDSTKSRGRPKKMRENIGSEGGTGVAAELIKVGSDISEEMTMTISDKQTPLAEEGTTTARPRGRPRKKTENESEVGDDINVVKQLPFSEKKSADSKKRKRNQDYVVGKDKGGDGELSEKQTASGIRKKKVDPVLGNNSGLLEEGSPLTEQALSSNEAPNVDKDDFSTKERSNSSTSLRERKKSKYLSPPYTLLSQWKKNGISENDSKKKTSNNSSNSIGEDSDARAVTPSTSMPIHRELSKESSPNCNTSGSLRPLQPSESHKTTDESNVPTHEILSDFRTAALDPSYLTKKQSDDSIKGFFTKFRSSSYQDGSDFTVHNNQLAGRSSYQDGSDFTVHNNQLAGRGSRKRVSFDIKSGLSGNVGSESGHATSEGESKRKSSKRKESELSPKASKDVDNMSRMHGDSSVAVLLITFAPGVSLPSKHELITTFSPFGALKESETEIIEDSGCAQVVFASRSDAEDAYKNSDSISSFGSSVASYRLRYVPVISKASDNVDSARPNHHSSSLPVNDVLCPQVSEVPPLQSVKQNLQMATSALESSWDKLSSDLKASLDTEIKCLLSKVTSMVQPS